MIRQKSEKNQEKINIVSDKRQGDWLRSASMATLLLILVVLLLGMIRFYYVELDNQLFVERSKHLHEITEKVADILDITIARSWDSVNILEQDGNKGYWRELPMIIKNQSLNYNLSLVNQRDVDGAVYSSPANYSILCMLYNKTLGFGDTISKLQELIDAGAFDIADKEAKNNDVTDNLLNRKAAMSFTIGGFSYLVTNLKECRDEIGGFPYLGDTPEQQFLNVSVNNIGISKKLSEPGNEKKLEAALKVMEYLSTEEGQNAMHVAVTNVSPLAGSVPSDEFPPYKDVWDVFSSGSTAPYILEGYEDIWVEAGTFVKNELFTGGRLDGLSEKMDELHELSLGEGSAPVHVATFPEDMAHLQTVQLMADLLLGAGGDVAVVSDGGAKDGVPNTGGVSGRLFAGELDHDSYSVCIPGNSGKTLVKLILTGGELFRLLENGRTMTYEDKSAVFDYYWAGMDAVLENGKIVSAVLSDGRSVEKDGEYTVIISAVDYDAEAYPGGEDTGSIIKEAYLEFMTDKTFTAPEKLCR